MIRLLHNSLTTPSHDGGGRVQLDRQLHAQDPGEQETKFSDSHEGGKSSDSQVVGKTKSGKSHGWVNSTGPSKIDEIAELCKVLASIPGLFCTNDCESQESQVQSHPHVESVCRKTWSWIEDGL